MLLKVGDRFKSYSDFKIKLTEYQDATFTKYTIRDCRTLKAQIRRLPRILIYNVPKEIKYYYVRLICYNRSLDQQLLIQSKHYSECTSFILLNLSSCRQFLEVKEFSKNHSCHLGECQILPETINGVSNKLKDDDDFCSPNHCSRIIIKESVSDQSDSNINNDVIFNKEISNKKKSAYKRKRKQTVSSSNQSLSRYEKFITVHEKLWQLAKLCSNLPNDKFQKRIKFFDGLLNKWSRDSAGNPEEIYLNKDLKKRLKDSEVDNMLDEIVNGEAVMEDDTYVGEEYFLRLSNSQPIAYLSANTFSNEDIPAKSNRKKTVKLTTQFSNKLI